MSRAPVTPRSMPCTGWCTGTGMVPGGYTGWVLGGVYRYPASCSRREPQTSEAGPGSPRGAGVGGSGLGRDEAAGRPWYHPSGPVGPPGPSLYQDPRNAASVPVGRDSTSFSIKLVKTRKCRRNMSIRPVIVPVSKNRLKSHLLKFSDFHIRKPSLTRN